MRVVHFSDWHGKVFDLPPADVYVCTGDMLPNFPVTVPVTGGMAPGAWEAGADVKIVEKFLSEREVAMQSAYLAWKGPGYLRGHFGNPDAPVVTCRGNHDFVDLAPMFGGAVFEISEDAARTVVIGGLKFGGVRGVIPHSGTWCDELSDAEFATRVSRLPDDLDILVTHSPPRGILDRHRDGFLLGSRALRSYVDRHQAGGTLKAHCFGHVHEACGRTTSGATAYSNAATSWREIDF